MLMNLTENYEELNKELANRQVGQEDSPRRYNEDDRKSIRDAGDGVEVYATLN